MEFKKELNWDSDTISGIFGYSTLEELIEEEQELEAIAVIFGIISNELTNREMYIIVGTLKTVTGLELKSTMELFKYLAKLSHEELEQFASYLTTIIMDIEND